ncbi:MAG: S8 family serine peptidase [Candidatus Hydrogenedentes bacterium]|nr:S8 family serine peptidase [Candidatus Hydrogenedentota bacterium]
MTQRLNWVGLLVLAVLLGGVSPTLPCSASDADGAALKNSLREAPSVPGERLYYYNGPMRVDVVLSLDELAVRAPGGGSTKSVDAVVPGAATASMGRSGRMHVQLDAAEPGVAGLQAKAASLSAQGYAVEGVLYPRDTRFDTAKNTTTNSARVLTGRLSVKLAEGHTIDEVTASYNVSVVEKVAYSPSTYILEVNSTGLTDSLDIANALYESGMAVFATPLIAQRQQLRLTPDDPLFYQQWHLENTGSPPGGAVAGNDVNIMGAWDAATGSGVNIAIVDEGVEETHEDLAGNARTDLSTDICDGDDDPSPEAGEYHGTACAGVAAAVGNNAKGVAGAAFEAGLVGVRLSPTDLTTDAEYAASLQYLATAADPDDRVQVYSCSWGPADDGETIETFGPLALAAVENAITNGRGGLGAVYTWAAGNGRNSYDNVNFDGWASSRYTIAVGATGAEGTYSYYSEPGASMLVNVPSDYYVTSAISGGIATTDVTGSSGYSSTAYTDYTYAGGFGGTSSAAPLAAGVVGLMLEENPALTWRDVQHVLVTTATKNDPTDTGWIQNGASRWFNHAYGFGRINAAAAVYTAGAWVNMPSSATPLVNSEAITVLIPDNNTSGITRTLSIAGSGYFVAEHVEVTVDVTHTYRGDLSFLLTSPSGTVSELATARGADSTPNYNGWMFTSVAHWGENPNGTWSLRVIDNFTDDIGTLNGWTLRIRGYETVTGPVLSVTPGSRSVSEAAGTTTFDVANAGTGTLDWTAEVESSATWLSIASGSSGTAPGAISLDYDENTSIYPRTATITVTATGASNSPIEVTVEQDGIPAPELSVTPAVRSVAYTAGTTSFGVENLGTGTMTWSAISNETWLSVLAPGSGEDSGTFVVQFTENPWTSVRQGTITVIAAGAVNSPATVTVSQSANPSLSLSVTPSSRSVSSAAGSTTFSVANTGGGTMDWYADVDASSTWLTITSDDSGTNSGTLVIAYESSSSTSGRTGYITVTAPGAANSPRTVSVVQSCAAPAAPTGVSASDGAYSDRVRITWAAVSGASSYRVYRGSTNSFASASSLGVWPETSFDDYSASGPTTSSDGCNSSTTYVKYYYWVTAISSCGEGTAGSSDQGWVGASKQSASAGGILLLLATPAALALVSRRRKR